MFMTSSIHAQVTIVVVMFMSIEHVQTQNVQYPHPEKYFVDTNSLNSLAVPFEEQDVYMGIEIEISYDSYDKRNEAIMSFVHLHSTTYFSNWVLQDEYCIQYCIEYTSYPLRYKTMLEEIPKITAFIDMTGGKVNNMETGIHLHVSRKSIEKYKPVPSMTAYAHHKYLWWKINNKKYRKDLIELAGRETFYAYFDDLQKSEYDDHVGSSISQEYSYCSRLYSDAYKALNLIPEKTIEFRIFKSSTDTDIIKQYINKVHDLITNISDYDVYLSDS